MDRLYQKLKEIFMPHSHVICDIFVSELLEDVVEMVLQCQNVKDIKDPNEIKKSIINEMLNKVKNDS